MKRICLALLTGLGLAGGCKTSQNLPSGEPVVARLGNTPVSVAEFKAVYGKNGVANGDTVFTDSAAAARNLRNYLDLYLNFRLKVLDAESLGLDTLESFRQELEGYKEQLAQPYLTDKSVSEGLVQQAYDRLKEEVRASHLLINVGPEAEPADTLKAWQQIDDLRKRVLAGEDFTALARQYSQDPSATTNGGDLGWFTGLQMVYPFEQAAYATPVGNLTGPVRTRFGYHLVKVTGRRPARGQVQTAHLMIRTNPEMPADEAQAARRRIEELRRKLQSGAKWEALVEEFSEDFTSRNKGGVLPIFGTGTMVPAFEEAAFALRQPGEVSEPVQTPYGWHLIRLIEKKGLEPFAELEPTIRQKVARDSRSDLNRQALLNRLKRDNALVEYPAGQTLMLAQANDSLRNGNWTFDATNRAFNQPLFSIKETKYSVGQFLEYVKSRQRRGEQSTPTALLKRYYQQYSEEQLLDYERQHLEEKYPEYRALVKEYRDGMLFFQRMQDEVWDKALSDTTGAQAWFESNRSTYAWGQRVAATVYNAADNATLTRLTQTYLPKSHYEVPNAGLPTLYFARNDARLTPEYTAALDGLAARLVADTSLRLEIGGHADLRETGAVSAARTRTVTDYLSAKKVPLTQLILRNSGRLLPVSSTDRAKNRRVSLMLLSSDKKTLEKIFNREGALTLQITEGLFAAGDNVVVDKTPRTPGRHRAESNGRQVLVEITRVEAPRPKTWPEARGTVISDYQNELERRWLERLRQRYPVQVNEAEVQTLTREAVRK